MRPLARFRTDLAEGRNLDLYATFGIAITFGVLGAIDVVDPELVAATTLATLALVAVGALGTRRQIEAMESTTRDLGLQLRQFGAVVSADEFLSPSTSGQDLNLQDAMDIRLVGVSLSRTIRNNIDALERRMARGAQIKIALIEPGSDAVREAARRSTIPDEPEIFENRIRPTVDMLRQLAATPAAAGRMEVRFLTFVPVFGLSMVDPDEPEGQINVDIYAHRSAGAEPVLRLSSRRDPRWYHHFRQEFERIWTHGRVVSWTEGAGTSTPRTP